MDPSLRTLLLAAPLVILAGLARPRAPTVLDNRGVHPARFWAEKARTQGTLDVALAGDSRVFRGLAPSAMREVLGEQRVGNVAFSAACLCEPYLAFVERALDPRATARTIVLGVTPHSLTRHAAKDNGYAAETRRSRAETLERLYLTPTMDFLEPVRPTDISHLVFGGGTPPVRYMQRFHSDGWVESRLEPPEPDRALREYERALGESRVDALLVDELIEATRRWKAMGIRIVGFRPPVSPAMRALEDRLGAFDEGVVRARFQSAGGEYLGHDDAVYPTYDGSHVDGAVAVALSRDLATRLRRLP